MNFSVLPSLWSMAATRIVTRLWNRDNVVALVAEWNESCTGEDWKKIEKNVKEKISLLCQPAPLREKLSSFVAPIGDEIMRWKESHAVWFGIKNNPREFCWTSLGTLDKKGTAEAFVCDPSIPEGERYCIACFYCLEWDGPIPFFETEHFGLCKFQAYWTYDRTGDATALYEMIERDTSKTSYQWAFHWAVEWGNEVAADYYLRKLNPEEREESLSDVQLPFVMDCDDLTDFVMYRFLLLHMDEGQRSKLFEECAQDILNSLLAWPWQPLFMGGARHLRDYLEAHEYSYLLSQIVNKIEAGYEDYDYGELYGTFWIQIPPDHKNDLLQDSYLLSELLPFVGEKNISLMLTEASPEERERFLLGAGGERTCLSLARRGEWDALEFFIHECLSSRDRIIHFSEECRKRTDVFGSTFFECIDRLIEKGSEKRGGEETDCPVSPKRLCGSPDMLTNHA